MVRLREIDRAIEEHERRLAEAWEELRAEVGDRPDELARRWLGVARGWRFVNGRPYRREPLDARWILARFPAERAA